MLVGVNTLSSAFAEISSPSNGANLSQESLIRIFDVTVLLVQRPSLYLLPHVRASPRIHLDHLAPILVLGLDAGAIVLHLFAAHLYVCLHLCIRPIVTKYTIDLPALAFTAAYHPSDADADVDRLDVGIWAGLYFTQVCLLRVAMGVVLWKTNGRCRGKGLRVCIQSYSWGLVPPVILVIVTVQPSRGGVVLVVGYNVLDPPDDALGVSKFVEHRRLLLESQRERVNAH
ncbi:hypothetical protein R3P38DRAFT_3183471 [Favolaschia claudopus]|uniref:Uncharacterized protein n=1 Tax=Favolaschia claudopus TaxID=2862362 RepID=A0AAW0C809_9AGAR